MGRLSNLRQVDPVLTNLAIGYTNEEMISDQILPPVDIDNEGARIPTWGRDAFKVYRTERALRAKSNRISPDDGGELLVALDEHDAEYPIDYREDAEAAFDLEAHGTYRATEAVMLRREHAVAGMLTNPANFPVGNKEALSTGDYFDDPASDPEAIIADARAAVRARIAKEPDTLTLGYRAAKALRRHPKLRALLSDSRARLLTLEDMAAIFEVRRVLIGRGVYDTDAGVQTDLWGPMALLTYTARGATDASGRTTRTPYEPSFGYTLRKRGSQRVDSRLEEGGKLQLVRYTDIYRPYILGAEAGYLITNVLKP